jgi:hypothetical protein
VEENDILYVLRQGYPVKFCMKLINSGKEMLDMLEGDCGSEIIHRPTVLSWWKHFKEGNRKVVDDA